MLPQGAQEDPASWASVEKHVGHQTEGSAWGGEGGRDVIGAVENVHEQQVNWRPASSGHCLCPLRQEGDSVLVVDCQVGPAQGRGGVSKSSFMQGSHASMSFSIV